MILVSIVVMVVVVLAVVLTVFTIIAYMYWRKKNLNTYITQNHEADSEEDTVKEDDPDLIDGTNQRSLDQSVGLGLIVDPNTNETLEEHNYAVTNFI